MGFQQRLEGDRTIKDGSWDNTWYAFGLRVNRLAGRLLAAVWSWLVGVSATRLA